MDHDDDSDHDDHDDDDHDDDDNNDDGNQYDNQGENIVRYEEISSFPPNGVERFQFSTRTGHYSQVVFSF